MVSPSIRYTRSWRWLAAAVLAGASGLVFGSCADEETAAPGPAVGGGHQGGDGGAGGADGGSGGGGVSLPFGLPEILAEGLDHPTRVEVDGEQIYWTAPAHEADGAVMVLAKSGGEPASLVTAVGEDVTALALDGTNLYWASVTEDGETGSISAVPVAGGASVALSSAGGWPGDIAVAESTIYWSYVGQGSGIWQAPKAGGAAEALYEDGSLVTFLWLDTDLLYFADTGTGPQTGAIGVVRLGSSLSTLVVEQLARPYYIVGDADYLYYATSGDGRIRRLTKEDEVVASMTSGQQGPYGVALDETALYWTARAPDPSTGDCDNADGSVRAWLFESGEVVELADGLRCPMGIAVDDDGIYWVNHGLDDDHETGSVMWIEKL